MGASDLANRGKQRQRQAQLMRSMSWQPGMPLTEAEERLLRPLREAARTLGRTPVYREVTEALQIKAHFRTWNLAIQAAGLPALTSPEQTQIRALECEREKCGKALAFARAQGFCAAVIDTSEIVFDSSFRRYCAENLCGQYGANYSCPPNCGSFTAMQRIVTGYRKALVVQSQWELSDWNDFDSINRAQQAHTAAMLRIADCMHRVQSMGRMCGVGSCNLCEVCTRTTGEPCRHPDRMFSCLSAYCINVQKLAQTAGMDYVWGGKRLYLYGMILIGGRGKK